MQYNAKKKLGNPKTLTPCPQTPTTDQAHGLPTERSTDYPSDSPTDHSQNKIKTIIKISLTASPIDHSCRRNFERYAEKNVTDLGSMSSASLSLYIAISFAVTISMQE